VNLQTQRRSWGTESTIALVAIAALGAAFRAHHLLNGLDSDQLFDVSIIERLGQPFSWSQVLGPLSQFQQPDDSAFLRILRDTQPPGFIALLIGWTFVFGISDVSLKLLPFFLGSLAPVVMFVGIRRAVGYYPAALAGMALALSASAVQYSQSVRYLPLLMLMSTCTVALIVGRTLGADLQKQALSWRGFTFPTRFWLDAIVFAGLAWSSYAGAILCACLGLIYFWFVIRPGKHLGALVVIALVPLSLIPWILLNRYSLTHLGLVKFGAEDPSHFLPETMGLWGPGILAVAGAGLILLALAWLWQRQAWPGKGA
jgi:uncharacterized membrane protein